MSTQTHCTDTTPHNPHRTDRGAFGVRDCPGVPTRLPIHGECRHDHHATTTAPGDCQQVLDTLTDVWAALNRAGCHTPRASLDDATERLDRARYATRTGSRPGSAQGAPAGMQAFLDYSTAEFAAARTADDRVEVIRDLLEGWYDRWDAYYPGAVTDEHDGLARHLVTLITTESRASEGTTGTLIRYCVYPGCRRSYRADVGPSDRGWMRLRGLTVLCPDHSTYAAGSAQDTTEPAESHGQPPVDPGAGDAVGGTVPTAHSGPEDPEAGLRTGGTLPNGGTVVLGQDDSGCVIAPDAARHRAGDLAGHKVVVTRLHYDGLGALRSGDSAGSVVSRQREPAGALRELLDQLADVAEQAQG